MSITTSMEGQRRSKIFVDSNYFIALFNSQDSLCKQAEAMSQKLYTEDSSLVISNLIFLEVVTVLSQKRGRRAGIEAGIHFLTHPLLEFIHIDETLQEDTWRIFQQIKSKNMSFVDCSIIAVMNTEGIRELLTFDRKDFTPNSRRGAYS